MGLKNVLTLCRKKLRVDPSNLDADDPIEDESDDSVDEEDEDDTAELMAELQRIKAERASELAKKVLSLTYMLLFVKYTNCLFFRKWNRDKKRNVSEWKIF